MLTRRLIILVLLLIAVVFVHTLYQNHSLFKSANRVNVPKPLLAPRSPEELKRLNIELQSIRMDDLYDIQTKSRLPLSKEESTAELERLESLKKPNDEKHLKEHKWLEDDPSKALHHFDNLPLSEDDESVIANACPVLGGVSNMDGSLHQIGSGRHGIAIASIVTGKEEGLTEAVVANREAYARRWGYSFCMGTQMASVIDLERTPHWSKLLMVYTLLHHFEWVFWLDADALILNYDVPLEHFVADAVRRRSDETRDDHRSEPIDFILGANHGDLNDINTGAFFMRQTDWTKYVLKEAYHYKNVLVHGWHDQAAIMDIIQNSKEVSSHHYHITPITDFNAQPANYHSGRGMFVFHNAGCFYHAHEKDDAEAKKCVRAVLSKNKYLQGGDWVPFLDDGVAAEERMDWRAREIL
eukprot:TRINITY_DN4347_c0_g2_i1.p1 TRINITY_DN4347_c0_g2~~TRINITY_DN4347_c0_g2_i1.p1  ORF type:complete len:412 (-),score=97.82 TRINITY_DN4347_c0_g2_i1:53-1288(-)